MEPARITSLQLIILNQMRWSGGIVRIADERTPKHLFYGDVAREKRDQSKEML